jgi:hypothetical protein
MRFFFYGTLMDPGLLARVLGRRVSAHAPRRAWLFGYRRYGVEGAPFPIVLRMRGGRVRGVVLDRIPAAECRRLCSYEGAGYRLARAIAAAPGDARRSVLVFVPQPGAFVATGRPWSYARWRGTVRRAAIPSP